MQIQTRQVSGNSSDERGREERIAKLEPLVASFTSKGLPETCTHSLIWYMRGMLRTPLFEPNGADVENSIICSAETLHEARKKAIKAAEVAKTNGNTQNGNWHDQFMLFAERMGLAEGYKEAARLFGYEAFNSCYCSLNRLPYGSIDSKVSITIANEFKKHSNGMALAIMVECYAEERSGYVQAHPFPQALLETERIWQAGYGAVDAVEVRAGEVVVFGYKIRDQTSDLAFII